MSKFKLGDLVFYKGKEYTLIKEGTVIVTIQSGPEQRTLEPKHLLTPDEFEEVKKKRRSQHQNWIGP